MKRSEKIARFFDGCTEYFILLLLLTTLILLIKEQYLLLVNFNLISLSTLSAINGVLTVFLLLKIFGIFTYFLKYHYVSVSRVIDVGIIALVQELIFNYSHLDYKKLLATSLLLISLGVVYAIHKKYSENKQEVD